MITCVLIGCLPIDTTQLAAFPGTITMNLLYKSFLILFSIFFSKLLFGLPSIFSSIFICLLTAVYFLLCVIRLHLCLSARAKFPGVRLCTVWRNINIDIERAVNPKQQHIYVWLSKYGRMNDIHRSTYTLNEYETREKFGVQDMQRRKRLHALQQKLRSCNPMEGDRDGTQKTRRKQMMAKRDRWRKEECPRICINLGKLMSGYFRCAVYTKFFPSTCMLSVYLKRMLSYTNANRAVKIHITLQNYITLMCIYRPVCICIPCAFPLRNYKL